MHPRFESNFARKLTGMSTRMSLALNKTGDLWRSFMPRRKEIKHAISTDLYSVELYDPGFFNPFNLHAEFEKWAAVEVSSFDKVPEGMKTLILPTGLYAVFIHKGPASSGPQTYQYIFSTWLPGSDYLLDDRPHFALMGEKYKHEDPESEEELWIPVKPKLNSQP